MSKKIAEVPKIAITAESDDSDHHITLLSAECFTDVEDLDVANLSRSRSKSKLKIKVRNDGYMTDCEDMELSDNEEDSLSDAVPAPQSQFVLNEYVSEEVCHANMGDGKITAKFNVIEKSNDKTLLQKTKHCITDVENYSTENELCSQDAPSADWNLRDNECDVQEHILEKLTQNNREIKIRSKPKRRMNKHKQNTCSTNISSENSDTEINCVLLKAGTENVECPTDTELLNFTGEYYQNNEKRKRQNETDTESIESNTDYRDLSSSKTNDEIDLDFLHFDNNFSVTKFDKDENEKIVWKERVDLKGAEKRHTLNTKNFSTDEESFSDFDCSYYQFRARTPNFHAFEESVTRDAEKKLESDCFRKNTYHSDSELIVMDGEENLNRLSVVQSSATEGGYHTETEDLEVETNKKTSAIKETVATTDIENICDDDGSEINSLRRKSLRRKPQEIVTDMKVPNYSGEVSHTLSRAATGTPFRIHQDLDSSSSSRVRTETFKKLDLDTAMQQLHVRDIEDISTSDEGRQPYHNQRFSVNLANNKITLKLREANPDVKWDNYILQLNIYGGKGMQ